MQSLLRCLFVLALVALQPLAQAGVVLYTSEAAYLSAVGPTQAYVDFAGDAGLPVSGTGFSSDVYFGTCTDPALTTSCTTVVQQLGDAITDAGGAASSSGVGSLVWRINRGDIHAVGFNYRSGTLSQITLVDLMIDLRALDTAAASGFVGLVSDAPLFGGILLTPLSEAGRDRLFLDDFRLNELPDPSVRTVPEPAGPALAMLALGLALGVRQARRPA